MKIHPEVKIAKYSFGQNTIREIENDLFVKDFWPLIYILSSERIAEAYVGESTNALTRIQNHLSNPERIPLQTLHLITCGYFNKSAALDIESSLIKYLSADGKYKLQNGNAGLVNHNYYQSDLYRGLFKTIWQDLKKNNIVLQSLKKIDNSDLFKYSPYKALTTDQHTAVLQLIRSFVNNSSNSIFVEGSAGTGKTILAVYLIKLLRSEYLPEEKDELDPVNRQEVDLVKSFKEKYPQPKIALVVPMTSLRKTLKKVFKNVKGLNSNMVIGPSDVARNEYDLLIVDEAHRLRRRVNLTNYKSFDESNKLLGFDKNATELDWIEKQSKNQVFFYDKAQSIKPSDVRKEDFEFLKRKKRSPEPIKLKSQMRVAGGVDYINYIHKLLNCELDKNNKVFQSRNYEFILFESLESLMKKLQAKENEFGLCRLVAGYSWAWKSKKKNTTDIHIQNLKLKWNSVNEDWINSKGAIDEVGCIHTTQGYDLNYTGVIFGEEISYDPKSNQIVINEKNYHDRNGKAGIKKPEDLKEYIINIYTTLMFRGVKGTYVYVCDKNLRDYLKRHIITKKD